MMFKKLLQLLSICLALFVFQAFAQEKEKELPQPEPSGELKPIENSKQEPRPTQPPASNNNSGKDSRSQNRNNDRDRKDKGKHDRDRDKDCDNGKRCGRDDKQSRNKDRKHRRHDDIYYPTDVSYTPTVPRSMNSYFDREDVSYYTFDAYLEPNSSKYLPYFMSPLARDLEPLIPAYIHEHSPNKFPFTTQDWTMYYETELDDFFIDFSKLGNHSFERLLLTPFGDMAKKVAKKLDRVGQESRPTILETLPPVKAGKIYGFSLVGLPKGDYELKLIARDGNTVRRIITIK